MKRQSCLLHGIHVAAYIQALVSDFFIRCCSPGGTHIKRTGVLVGNFLNNPQEVRRSCFMRVA